MSNELALNERARLAELEDVVERGLTTFVEVGQALMEVRDARLYREAHGTFEDYCRERWGFRREVGDRYIRAAEVAGVLNPTGLPGPANEAQARELVPLVQDAVQAVEVWRELREEFGERVTAKAVRRLVRARLNRKVREEARAEQREAIRAEYRERGFVSGTEDGWVSTPIYDSVPDWLLRRLGRIINDAAAAARPDRYRKNRLGATERVPELVDALPGVRDALESAEAAWSRMWERIDAEASRAADVFASEAAPALLELIRTAPEDTFLIGERHVLRGESGDERCVAIRADIRDLF